ncbi:MAG: response regulator, partial [Marinilabiliaceae bacterium]
ALYDRIRAVAPDAKTILFATHNKHSYYGFEVVLEKPVKHTELYTTIRQLFFEQEEGGASQEQIFSTRKNKNILLVEDNPINQKITEKMLGRIGLSSSLAQNGQEAIEMVMADQDGFDLILMDIQMPVMNGLDATRKLREAGISLPIIAMTANVLKGDREICLNAGMDDYIGKPVKLNDLQHTIQKWV